MRKYFAAFSLVVAIPVALAGTAEQDAMSACEQTWRSQCWTPYERLLAQRESTQHPETLLFEYRALATMALTAGDLPDALRLLSHARTLVADAADPDMRAVAALLDIDASLVLLGAGDYSKSLVILDSAVQQLSVRDQNIANNPRIQLMRSAVLIGLGNHADAEALLQKLEATLDFESMPPMCGLAWLFIPPLNPYEAGLRIASFYQRTGQQARAQGLLKLMEKSRSAMQLKGELYLGSWAQPENRDGLRGFDPYGITLGLDLR